MRAFAQRSGQAELMDAGDTPYPVFRDCLTDLAKVNAVTLGFRPTLEFLERLRRAGRFDLARPVVILDAGSGGGDGLAAIDRWASRRGVTVRLVGVDLNPWSARAARERYPDLDAEWITGDVLAHADEADVIVSCLLAHHLSDAQVVEFIRWMERCGRAGWFVNDLHRHPLPFYGFALLARLARWHRFVRHDGPVSIARAFVAEDWRRLRAQAGVAAKVRWRFPFRLCVERVR